MQAEPGFTHHPASRKAILLLLVAWLAFHFPMFAGKVFFPTEVAQSLSPNSLAPHGALKSANWLDQDAYTYEFAVHTYLGTSLRSGRFPFWDPHRLAGTPFAANPLTGSWYPPNWLYAVGHTVGVATVLSSLTFLAGLLLMFWFLRVLRLHPYAAALGAIVFLGSGFLMGWRMNSSVLGSAIWAPLALGGIETAFGPRTKRGILLCGLGLALTVLAGHVQVALYTWLSTGLWTIAHALAGGWSRRRDGTSSVLTHVLRPGTLLLASATLAAGLAALPILSAGELSRHALRQHFSLHEQTSRFTLAPTRVETLVLPDRFGNPSNGLYYSKANFTETALYAGILPLVLAAYGLARRRDRHLLAAGAIAVVGFGAVFGTFVYRVLYFVVPGVARTKANRFIFLADLSIAILAALGLDEALARGREARRTLSILFVAAGLAALASSLDGLSAGVRFGSYLLPRVAFAWIALGLAALFGFRALRGEARNASILVLIALADLWVFGYRYHLFGERETVDRAGAIVQEIRAVNGTRPRYADVGDIGEFWLPPNSGLYWDTYTIGAYEPFALERTVELLESGDAKRIALLYNEIGPVRPGETHSSVLDLLGVRALVSRAPDGDRLEVSTHDALPPAFMTHCWEPMLVPVRELSSDALRRTAFLEENPGGGVARGPCANGQAGSPARITTYTAERVAMSVETQSPGVLVLTDAWYPGWEARVDGNPARMLRVDLALRGVVVSPGLHNVEWRYRPRWLVPGAAATLAALTAAAALIVGERKRSRASA